MGGDDRFRFRSCRAHMEPVRELGPKDDFVVQQQVLATDNSKEPTEAAALAEAREILGYLWPQKSLDPETLGIWAAVHKRLYELEQDPEALDEAITASEKGFVLQGDYFNGINLAFLLDTRAHTAESELAREDHARARSTRRRVAEISKAKLDSLEPTSDERYWLIATLEEAAVGLGDDAAAADWHAQAVAAEPADWMLDSTVEQIDKLRIVLPDVGAGSAA